ncbi:uncharacterized protein BXZ73DRAFT_89421 [Epithele typhae]|uniref:uncharacterized protein n=1 Tax=Epithele typhae TaxID=378194 RepID=UPI002008AC14|nr:uncharacterized protein BXZ73DRAFT_89421 [Epithele typhae]KAH9935930.1 hypothetical protein BXZ73DRAFT_89421 [Epithele typhae]
MHDGDQMPVPFVKGGKRKRLTKACDACHKSKRRCDGTDPLLISSHSLRPPSGAHSYYASKSCTYTDAAGRPVPAPRNTQPERSVVAAAPTTCPISNEPPPWAAQATLASPPVGRGQGAVERDPTSKRSRQGPSSPETSPPLRHRGDVAAAESLASPLDPVVTHELVNIFFAHCNPQRMIIHKPTFSADLGMNKLPAYLLLAVCAVAAPLSKSKCVLSKASHARLAGVPFFKEALALMFDNSGRLLCEPSVSTAQALCLLEMHEIAASHSWTNHLRYFELAFQVLEGSLQVDKADNSVPPAPNDQEGILRFIDRECTRRCFWLILTITWISNIYTRRGVRPRMSELADVVRLPIDEAIFELTSLTSAATVEYLRRPAPRTRYASQFGHMLRILEIYDTAQSALSGQGGAERVEAMHVVRTNMQEWVDSLPAHLRFNEENLETQISMFETSSNSGAWCFCFMHAMHPCCYLAVQEGEGTLGDPVPWIRSQLNHIFNAAGTRAKTSILCTADDPQIHVWDRDFEKIWGFRVVLVAITQAQQNQAQMYKPRGSPHSSKSSSNSPTSSNSSPPAVQLHAQPYEGRQGNPRALLRTNVAVTLDGAAHVQAEQMNLPSLKASGLLDSWKPPSEAFASSLSLGSQSSSTRDSPRRHPPSQNSVAPAAAAPAGLTWLANSGAAHAT